jgi:hypothetical protein
MVGATLQTSLAETETEKRNVHDTIRKGRDEVAKAVDRGQA